MSRNFDIVIEGKLMDIKKDITAYESNKLNQLILVSMMAAQADADLDVNWFIKENKLERHFKEIK